MPKRSKSRVSPEVYAGRERTERAEKGAFEVEPISRYLADLSATDEIIARYGLDPGERRALSAMIARQMTTSREKSERMRKVLSKIRREAEQGRGMSSEEIRLVMALGGL